MKRKISLLIVVLLLLAGMLLSCKEKAPDNVPPADPVDQVKQAVIDLMQTSEAQKDPAELFAAFAGDFSITNFKTNDAGVKDIKRKAAVTAVSTKYAKYYGVEAAGFLFYVDDVDFAVTHLTLSADAADKSTMFTVFGLDTSALWGNEAESDEIVLTKEMLSVSEDLTTCTFAKSYLDELAKLLCETMGYSDKQTRIFLTEYEGSGVYSVAENKYRFEIKLDDFELGKITQITSYSIAPDGKVNAYAYMEYSNRALGITKPIVSEIEYTDVVYQGNAPISATITMKNTESTSVYEGQVEIKFDTTKTYSFELDVSDSAKPRAKATMKRKTVETAMGESLTFTTDLALTLDLGKSVSPFSFTQKHNGDLSVSLKADTVTFGTPTGFTAVPQKATNAITEYILEMD